MSKYLLIIVSVFLFACQQNKDLKQDSKYRTMDDPNEIFGYYSDPKTEMVYSEFVADSFKIFSAVPKGYDKDTAATYPLILMVDANGYFEAVLAELKLARLTLGLPKAIVVGIGYKNFWAMDSLRDRDYTFPAMAIEDGSRIGGGANKFTQFINQELLPKISSQFRVDNEKVVLMGHSLGGYYALYHMIQSLESNNNPIRQYIAASPYIGYGNNYILNQEMNLSKGGNGLPITLYVSNGSLEYSDSTEVNLTPQLQTKLQTIPTLKMKFVEYGNFNHMDAAMPGFIKGLVFVFEK